MNANCRRWGASSGDPSVEQLPYDRRARRNATPPRTATASAAAPMRSGADGPPPASGAGVSCTATALGDEDTVRVSTAAVGDGLGLGVGVAGSVVAASVGGAAGGAVRTGVGRTVGGGGGGAVGGGGGGAVGAGVPAWTMTVPCMEGPWTAQSYGKVPAAVNASDPLWPCDRIGVPLCGNRALCAAAS
jgi:hypothetical protein